MDRKQLELRHVVKPDGVRTEPGWYIVDVLVEPAATVRGPVSEPRARQLFAILGPAYNISRR